MMSIVTNGFFAKDDNSARVVLDILAKAVKERKLRAQAAGSWFELQLGLSVDIFHQNIVPLNNLKHIISVNNYI